MPAQNNSVILFGDSIIDNENYVGETGRSVLQHLQEANLNFTIDQRALDGAVCRHVLDHQITSNEDFSDHAVLSVGGNDAFGNIHFLESVDQQTFLETMLALNEIQETFRVSYSQILGTLGASFHRCLVMTIYRPRFTHFGYPEEIQRAAETALSTYNDVIQEEAGTRNFDILDLRSVCNDDDDFYNPIEPNNQGGQKIAYAIRDWLT